MNVIESGMETRETIPYRETGMLTCDICGNSTMYGQVRLGNVILSCAKCGRQL